MFFLLRYIFFISICLSFCSQSISGEIPLNKLIKMSIEDLIELKITTAGKKEEKISEIPASVVIITSEDIKRYGYTSISEILKNVPGLYAITDVSGYATTFGIRGFWSGNPKNIIFLVNGVKQGEAIFNSYMIQNFDLPVEIIDRIEVIRGPMSVIYGEGAFFGAINIITDKKKNENFVLASYGSQNTIRTALKSSGKEGKANYSLSAGYFNTNGPDESLYRMTNNSNRLKLLGINSENDTTKERLEVKNKHVNLSLNLENFYSRLSFNENIEEIYGGLPAISDGSFYLRRNIHFKVGVKKKINNFFSYDINIAYHNYDMHLNFDLNSIGYNYSNGKSTSYETEWLAYLNFSEQFDLTTGICLRESRDIKFGGELDIIKVSSNDILDDKIKTYSIFTQANYALSSKIKFIAGMRLEKLSKFNYLHLDSIDNIEKKIYQEDYIDFIPRLAAVYQMNKKNIFKFMYGKANAKPSFFQIRDQVLGRKNNLQNEYIETFELNYISFPCKYFSFSSSLFFNTLDKLIVRKLDVSRGNHIAYGSNSGKINTKGIELTSQFFFKEQFHAELSFMYQDSEDQRDFYKNMNTPYSPKILGYFKASYRFGNTLTLSVNGNYVDEMETLWDETKENPDGTYGNYVGEKTDDYFTLDANIRIDDFIKKGLFISIHGSNLFNKEYLHPCSSSTFFEKGSIGMGRLLMISMGIKL